MAIDWDGLVLGPMMSADVFGEDEQPTYTPAAGGVAFQVDGVFDRPYTGLTIAAEGEPEIATAAPSLGVRLSQFAALPVKGDKVFVPSVNQTYLVSDVHPDGKGWARLFLTIAAP